MRHLRDCTRCTRTTRQRPVDLIVRYANAFCFMQMGKLNQSKEIEKLAIYFTNGETGNNYSKYKCNERSSRFR